MLQKWNQTAPADVSKAQIMAENNLKVHSVQFVQCLK